MSKVWLNSLFQIEHLYLPLSGNHDYTLIYRGGPENQFVRIESGEGKWATNPDILQRYGEVLLSKYLHDTEQYILYAVIISSKGGVKIRWFSEKMARDTLLQFAQGLQRPHEWSWREFEFLTHRDYNKKRIEMAAITRYYEILNRDLT